jgi:hypothetical protein
MLAFMSSIMAKMIHRSSFGLRGFPLAEPFLQLGFYGGTDPSLDLLDLSPHRGVVVGVWVKQSPGDRLERGIWLNPHRVELPNCIEVRGGAEPVGGFAV